MAEAETPNANDAPAQQSGGKKKLIALIGGIVVVEAVAMFLALKMFGVGPSAGEASIVATTQPAQNDPLSSIEIEICQFRAPNEKTGQLFVYDLKVAAAVERDRREEVEPLIQNMKSKIQDRLIRIVRRAEPGQLREEDLSSLRRQIKYELDKLLQDDTMISEVLIPYFQKYRSDL